jgi:hypothetical protein
MQWIILQSQKTAAEIESQLLAYFASVGLPTDAWVKGGIWDNLTKWFAQLLVLVYTLILYIAQGAFLATASGNLLTDLAAGTFGTARRTETFATGPFTLTNGGLDPIDEPIDSLTFENTADTTITYRNSEAVYILPGNSQTFSIVCDVAGTIGNALTSDVAMTTTIVGATGTNPSPIAGQDEQEDADLARLCSLQASDASTGHADKYQWVIENLNTDGSISTPNDGKTRVNVNRVSVNEESVDGTVTIVLASPAGAVDAGEYATCVTAIEQIAQGNAAILDNYNATPVALDIAASVILRKGASTAGVALAIREYVTAWFVSTENGIASDNGTLSLKELEGVIYRSRSNIKSVTMQTINGNPAANVALAFNEVATLTLFVAVVSVET